jgi:tRNA pseudouridine32 synthase / 23S rRNA pseudouridine746 synthase
MTPEEIVARLIYRDGLMLVIDKPAGWAVHKGPKGGESLEDYFGALRFGLPRAPALAHRLDRDTSGCLVLGRHRKALAALGRLFKSEQIGKTYWAVVAGGPTSDEGRIELPLGRKDATRGWWMKHDPLGQPAVTMWKVMGRTKYDAAPNDPAFATAGVTRVSSPACRAGLGQTSGFLPSQPTPSRQAEEAADQAKDVGINSPHLTWLALEPMTGRTHQLRVHCAAMGWPIVGDSIYGSAARTDAPGLHLHAREIVVPLYKNRAPIRITAPVPSHMRQLLHACGWSGDALAE